MKKSYFYSLVFILTVITVLIFTACDKYVTKNLIQPKLSNLECRLIKHELGETCVPLNPKRIIVTDQVSLEALLALEVKPIGVPDTAFVASKASFLQSKMADIVYIGKEHQFNLETILKLQPDLIVSLYGINPESYKLFSQIAPTVKLKYIHNQWKESLLLIAEVVNKSDEAKELLAKYQQRLEKLRTTLGDKIKKIEVSVSRFHAQVQLPEFRSQYSFPGSILTEIGMNMPVNQRRLINTPDDTLVILSLERVDLLDADVLFVAVDPGAKELFQKYQNSQIWQTLDVVQNQRVYSVDTSYWIFGNILSANAILDDLSKYLVGSS
ncbi:MAG: iron-siderophore ABC transporter substrate-binding protein [Chlorogloeopsis fritschii C42_A2020_084]|uniref:iron-siderophore ABC transporter substrate-binding protein n=1 Tax=Chlorogloeopsis fritschii TaxID=1124 RepID=UPI0019F880B5|nr:iron-siderophore ABC transporter substrate-binding protein [Chlorogloeopsis fritschii]MBF2009056.1 iron-siderophore ABC transporter substrate-binding protein [Chlorogloeopsis fritschii C42_A2020_084]